MLFRRTLVRFCQTTEGPATTMSVTVRRPQDKGMLRPVLKGSALGTSGNVKRMLLIRNGQTNMAKDPGAILSTPDWQIPVSDDGYRETLEAGKTLARMLQREPVYIYFSPFLRSKQSLEALLEGALQVRKLNIVGIREDVRLRDGDIGRYTSAQEFTDTQKEQEKYGPFFYRFPHGESGADVCDRVSSFLDVFQREKASFPPNTNVVVMTHDMTIRMFVKRWFHLTVDTFHRMQHVPNSEFIELYRTEQDQYKFKLTEESNKLLGLPLSLKEEEGYAYRNTQLLGSLSTGAPFL